MKQKLNNTSSFRNFDWDKAKTFYYVAHLGSFTKCAEVLNLCQPALSRQISSLEKSLGSLLFIRKSKGLEMTRKGEELLEIISDTFDRLGVFTAKDKTPIERGLPRTIRMGIERGLEYLVISSLESYQRENPNLSFDIILDMPPQSPHILDLDMSICRTMTNFLDCHVHLLYQMNSRISFGKTLTISGTATSLKRIYAVVPSHLKDDEEISLIRQLLTREVD